MDIDKDSLIKLSEIICKSPNHKLHHNIIEYIRKITRADTVSYMIYDQDNDCLEHRFGYPGNIKFFKKLGLGKGISGRCAQLLKTVYVPDVHNDPEFGSYYLCVDDRVKSELAIPLVLDKQLFAVLDLESYQLDGFNQDIRNAAVLICLNALIALSNSEHVHRLNISNWKLSQYVNFNSSLKTINFYDNGIQGVLNDTLKSVYEIIPYSYSSIWLLNPEMPFPGIEIDQSLSLVSFRSSNDISVPEQKWINLEHSLTGRTISDNKIFTIPKLSNEPLFANKKLIEKLELSAMISVPLPKSNGRNIKESIGAINLFFSENHFEDENVLKFIADQISDCINKIILIEKEKIINNLLEYPRKTLDEYLKNSIEIIQTYGSEAVSIFLADKSSNILKLKATTGIKGVSDTNNVFYEYGQGLIGQIALSKNAIIIHDLSNENVKKICKGIWVESTRNSLKSFLGYPILSKDDEVLGVIRCINKLNKSFDNEVHVYSYIDISLMSVISRSLALYVENDRANKVRSDLLAKIPHDLRSPIVSARNIAKNSIRFKNHPKFNIDIKMNDLLEECELMFLLINQLHKNDQYKFELTRLRSEVLIKLTNLLKLYAKNSGIDSIDYYNLDCIPILYIDKQQMEILFYNLIINAIKYSYKGTSVTITASSQNNDTIIKIENWGIGIESKYKSRVFDPGFRTPEAINTNVVGTGWGLSIAKEIAARHKCELSLTSLSSPTIFTLIIPSFLSVRRPL